MKITKIQISAVLAAMSVISSQTAFAAPFGSNLEDNAQPGTTFVSTLNGDTIRFGAFDSFSGGGSALNSTVPQTFVTTADPLINNVYTPLTNLAPTLSGTDTGGLEIDPTNGNTTVARESIAVDTLLTGLVRVRVQPVFSNDPANAPGIRGQPAGPDGVAYGTLSGSTFVPLTGALSLATVSAIEAYAASPTSANALALMFQVDSNASDSALLSYTSGTSSPTAGTGNLTVEGSTTTNGIANGGQKITNVADGVNPTDAATFGQVTTEASTRASADTALTTRISAEETARASADTALRNDLVAETSNRASADTALRNDLVAEASTRASADTALRNDLVAETSTRASADTLLRNDLVAEASARASADTALTTRTTALEGRMGNAERNIKTLRKGVAMAAALQTPVINEGDNNAIKVGAAGFDGESGLAVGYARRINESVTVNAELATGFPDVIARGGVNYSF